MEIIFPVPAEPYEIVAATFDRHYYQNGIDTAYLTVVTRSNWGDSDAMSLSATMVPSAGSSVGLGLDEFSLEPGGEHVSEFIWSPVPEFPSLRHWDAYLELSDSRRFLLPLMVNVDVITTPIEEQVIVGAQGNMEACERGAACGSAFRSAVPFYGTVTAIQNAEAIHCLTEAFQEHGNARGASLLRFCEGLGLVMNGVNVFGEVLILTGVGAPGGGAFTLGSVLVDLANAAAICGAELAYWDSYGFRGRHGELISELADSALVSLERAGIEYSNEVLVQGRSSLRVVVEIDSVDYFTSVDSMGVTGAFVTTLPKRSSAWAHIGMAPLPLGSEGENPHDVSLVEVRPDSTDTLTVVLLHLLADSTVVKIEYPPLLTLPETVGRLWLADSIATVQMEVDLDGDGTVDFLWYPGATGVEEKMLQPQPGAPVLSLATTPNPTAGSTRLLLQSATSLKDVSVSVYDVAGRKARRLAVGDLVTGAHQILWDGRTGDGAQVASGIYYCVATYAGGVGATNRLVVLR